MQVRCRKLTDAFSREPSHANDLVVIAESKDERLESLIDGRIVRTVKV